MAMIKIQGSTKLQGKTIFDGGPTAASTAEAYIAAVESADGESLESGVAQAYTDFITGLWSDGTWSALKTSCILAGARTLDGALVPLVGTSPTNNNFVTADYSRTTGLIGNQSTKYLNTNQAENAASSSSEDIHIAINATTAETSSNLAYMGVYDGSVSPVCRTQINTYIRFATRGDWVSNFPYYDQVAGFHGTSRSGYATNSRSAGSTNTYTSSRNSSSSLPIYVFANNTNGTAGGFCNPRLSFYSIGGNIDLAKLDTRVSTLMTDLGNAIA